MWAKLCHRNMWCTTWGPKLSYCARVILSSFITSQAASKAPPTNGRNGRDLRSFSEEIEETVEETWPVSFLLTSQTLTESRLWPGATHLLWALSSFSNLLLSPGSWALPPKRRMFSNNFPRTLILLCKRRLLITSFGNVSASTLALTDTPADALAETSKSSSPQRKPFCRSSWSEDGSAFSRWSSLEKFWATQADCSLAFSASCTPESEVSMEDIAEVRAAPPIRPKVLQCIIGQPSSTGVTRMPACPMSITNAVASPAPRVARKVELKIQIDFKWRKFSNKVLQSSSRTLRSAEIGSDTMSLSSLLMKLLQNETSTRLSLKFRGDRITFRSARTPFSPAPTLKLCSPQSTMSVICFGAHPIFANPRDTQSWVPVHYSLAAKALSNSKAAFKAMQIGYVMFVQSNANIANMKTNCLWKES